MNLKHARQLSGLTQTELAEKAGTSQIVISYLETGKRLPKAKTKKAIEQILGEIDWIETRMQGPISTGFTEDEAPEEAVIRGIYIYVKSAHGTERKDRFRFLEAFLKKLKQTFE